MINIKVPAVIAVIVKDLVAEKKIAEPVACLYATYQQISNINITAVSGYHRVAIVEKCIQRQT